MEDTATIEPGTAVEAQSTETESAATPTPETQAAEPAGAPDVKALLKREEKDPYVQFTDDELDALEEHWGTSEKGKTKPKEPEPKVEADEDFDEGEQPEKEAKAKPEKKEEPEEEPEQGDDTPEAKAILKELGAKSLKEAQAKIKDLRKLVGGKDAQAVAKITRERDELISTQRAFFAALKRGDPSARAVAEKDFGVKIQGPQAEQQKQAVTPGDRFIDPAKFIDPESADLVEAAFQRQAAEIKALKDEFGVVKQERDRHVKDTVAKQSISKVVDEMADIAQYIPELKSIPAFREAAQAVLDGKPDPRLNVFEELFAIAASIRGATLKDAFDIKRGRDSNRIEAVAKQQGRKEAYEQKPNPSLSGMTGGKGEAIYQPVTPALLEKWANDHTTHPAAWYDKDENPVKSKIPKGAWSLFDFK